MVSDVLYEELGNRLLSLASDKDVNSLVDLCNTVQSNGKSQYLADSVRSASRCMHSGRALFLLKFVALYAKKDDRFFKYIEKYLASICVSTYQLAADKQVIQLYISGWHTRIQPWPAIATAASNTIALLIHESQLRSVCDLLQGAELPKGELDVSICEARMEAIIQAMNILDGCVRDGS